SESVRRLSDLRDHAVGGRVRIGQQQGIITKGIGDLLHVGRIVDTAREGAIPVVIGGRVDVVQTDMNGSRAHGSPSCSSLMPMSTTLPRTSRRQSRHGPVCGWPPFTNAARYRSVGCDRYSVSGRTKAISAEATFGPAVIAALALPCTPTIWPSSETRSTPSL